MSMTTLDHEPAHATLIRAADLVAAPWKNGGGVTREIAAFPPGATLDAFAWRVSVADVCSPGAFSRFEGIDRTLVLLSGAGMTLTSADGAPHVLDSPLARVDFAGETEIFAALQDGPTRDFNVMTRRSAARGAVEIWHGGTHCMACADTLLLFCATGTVDVSVDGGHYALEAMDTLRLDGRNREFDVALSGDGALLAVALNAAG